LLLPAILAGVGGIVGLFVGGAAVPAGSGLAGPTIVLGYGAVGAVCGLVAGAIAAWLLPARHVRPALLAALGLGLIAAVAVGIRVVRTNRERAERAGVEQQQRAAPFFAAAIADGPHDGSSFIDIRVDGKRDAFVMTARGQPERPTCRGTIDNEERARLLRVLRNAEDLLERDPDPCAGSGEPYRRFRWSLPERGGGEREVALTIACGKEHSELVALYIPFESIAFRATRGRGDVACE
jgi:hypothetical protein